MLCRLGGRRLRPLPGLQLGVRDPRFASAPTGGARPSALPVWAVASVSAVSPGGAGGWYEALASSAPVRGAEELLLGAHSAVGLPWWGSILLTTVALRGAVTLPLAAYQHYILAKVRGAEPRERSSALDTALCPGRFGAADQGHGLSSGGARAPRGRLVPGPGRGLRALREAASACVPLMWMFALSPYFPLYLKINGNKRYT